MVMGEEREFGDAIVEDAAPPINAGEDSFEVEDAGSDTVAVVVPQGKRWVDVSLVMRFEVKGNADADMVASQVFGGLHSTIGTEDDTMIVAEGSDFESLIRLIDCVKTGGVEQGIGS